MNDIFTIVPARPQDVSALAAIELAAAKLLEGCAPETVLAETTSEQAFLSAQQHGHLWVALVDDAPIGFAHVRILDSESAHLEEIDVLPAHGRRGVGTKLVMTICNWAKTSGYRYLSLTTFRHVPWNMPFYARLGFEVIPPQELTACMRSIVEDETRRGLDPEARVAMRRLCSV